MLLSVLGTVLLSVLGTVLPYVLRVALLRRGDAGVIYCCVSRLYNRVR
nr:hypothetical protein [Microbispora cellulosiformans]